MSDDLPVSSRTFPLRDTVANADVSQTLVTDESYSQAWAIYSKQPEIVSNPAFTEASQRVFFRPSIPSFMREFPPEQYVIRYYMMDDASDPVPAFPPGFTTYNADYVETRAANGEATRTPVPYLRSDNPAIPLNKNAKDAALAAMRTLEAQFPGRFRFERTENPEEADIRFGAVARSDSMDGTQYEGNILYNLSAFQGELTPWMRETALHEILHALGLKHPQPVTKEAGGPSTYVASYYDTALTYEVNNSLSAYPGTAYPISAMPADIEALLRLYPIKADKRDGVARIGDVPEAAPRGDFQFSVRSDAGTYAGSLPKNGQGLLFEPMPDTPNDTLVVDYGKPEKPRTDPNDWQREYFYINQMPNGTVIKAPYGEGETLIPTRLERIELSSRAESVDIQSNTTVYSPANDTSDPFNADIQDVLLVRGTGNRIDISAADIGEKGSYILLYPGSEATITVRDMYNWGSKTSIWDLINLRLPGDTLRDSGQLTWSRDNDGYHFTLQAARQPVIDPLAMQSPASLLAPEPIRFTVQFEDITPKQRAQFEAELASRAVYVSLGDSGWAYFPQQIAMPPQAPIEPAHGLPDTPSTPWSRPVGPIPR